MISHSLNQLCQLDVVSVQLMILVLEEGNLCLYLLALALVPAGFRFLLSDVRLHSLSALVKVCDVLLRERLCLQGFLQLSNLLREGIHLSSVGLLSLGRLSLKLLELSFVLP